MLLTGKKFEGEEKDYTITIMFDKALFSEHAASAWWRIHRNRFVDAESFA